MAIRLASGEMPDHNTLRYMRLAFLMGLGLFMARSHGLMHFNRTLFRHVIAGSLLAILAGCVTSQGDRAEAPRDLMRDVSVQTDLSLATGKTRVAMLLPLTGPNAEIGQELWDAAVLSLFESGRDDIELVPHDTQATPSGAARAAENAVSDGSSVVIGPLFSTSVSAARPVLAAHGIRGIALSNNRAEARAPFFLIGSHPETQADALVSYLASTGRRRLKLFGPDIRYLHLLQERLLLLDKAGKIQLVDTRLYKTTASYTEIAKDVRAITLYDRRAKALKDFTTIFAEAWDRFEDPDEAMQAALEKLGTRMESARLHFASLTPDLPQERKSWAVTEEEYSAALSEFLRIYHRYLKEKDTPQKAMAEAITEFERHETLGKADFDAVLLPIGDKPLLVIAPMFAYFNAAQPDVWLLGTDIWDAAAQLKPKDLAGSRFVTLSSPAWTDFQTRFHKTFDRQPEPLSAAAYDAVRVAVAEKTATNRVVFDPAFLTRYDGFDGVIGKIHFLADGSNERTLQIVEMRENSINPVYTWDPALQESGPQPAMPGDPGKILAPPAPPTQPISALDIPSQKKS